MGATWALTVGGISGAEVPTGPGSLGTEGIDAEAGTKIAGDILCASVLATVGE